VIVEEVELWSTLCINCIIVNFPCTCICVVEVDISEKLELTALFIELISTASMFFEAVSSFALHSDPCFMHDHLLQLLSMSQESGLRSQDSGVKSLRSQDSGVRSLECRLRSQDSGVLTQSGLRSQESGLRSQDSGLV
jgi:hypothetical protein